MPPEVWGTAGIIITAILGFFGMRAAARQAAQAAKVTAAPESHRADVEGLNALAGRLERENKRLSERLDSLESWRREQHAVLRTHEAWDVEAVAKLRGARIIIADPPPLRA